MPCAPVVASPFPQIASLFSAEQQRPADTTTWDTPLSDPPSSPILRSNSLPPGQSFRQDNASAQSTDANGLIRRQIRIQWDSQQQIPLKASIRIRKKSTAQNIAVLDDTPRTGDAPTITLTLDQVVNLCMHPQSASAIEVENDGGSDQDEGLILLRQPDALHQNGGVQFQLTLRHRGSGEKPSAAEIRDWLANHQVLVSVADRPAVQRGLLEVVSTDDNAAARAPKPNAAPNSPALELPSPPPNLSATATKVAIYALIRFLFTVFNTNIFNPGTDFIFLFAPLAMAAML
ncbi:MAG: hypothetical protein AAFP90_22970, partial [Planctomycetota bacterium]